MSRPSPPGTRGCVCAACRRVFTSPSAFDKHQSQGGATVCHDPGATGMVILRYYDGHPVWGNPTSDADRERLARFRAKAA